MKTTMNPMEALRRLIEACKLIDFADCKDETVWQALVGAQGVAEGVLAEAANSYPYAAEVVKAMADAMSHGTGVVQISHIPFGKTLPSASLQTDWQAFHDWAKQNLGQGYSLESEEGIFVDKVTRWAFNGFKAGRRLAVFPPSAGSAAPAGEVERDAARYRWLTYANWIDEEVMKDHGIREGISETLDAAIDVGMAATKDHHD